MLLAVAATMSLACPAAPPAPATTTTAPAPTTPPGPAAPAGPVPGRWRAPLATADTPFALVAGTPIAGFDRPVHVVDAGGGRLLVVEQSGRIRAVDTSLEGGVVAAAPFADLRRLITSTAGEQGLLGLALHPRFAENRRVFVAYTGVDGDNTVAELKARPDGRAIDDVTPRVLMAIDDFASNHNGGHVVFGPDGRLWVGTGDGGGGGDPKKTAHNRRSQLGKMWRIDVDAAAPAPVMWGLGLRNPWRYAFDAATGDLWIADVGQNAWEEVHVVPRATSVAEVDFGWSEMEGRSCFRTDDCDQTRFDWPAFVYGHGGDPDSGCSITGGVVVDGRFIFSDYCSGRVKALRRVDDGVRVTTVLDSGRRVSSFGLDSAGTVWLVDHGGAIVPLRRQP